MTLAEQKVSQYKNEIAELSGVLPNAAEAYHRFTGACFEAGELDERTKQLIALGVSLCLGNEVCTFYHQEEARAKGATDRQILEAAAVAAATASGHIMSQGASRLLGVPAGTSGHQAADPASGMQDYLQDSEFAEVWKAESDYGSGRAVSPSY